MFTILNSSLKHRRSSKRFFSQSTRIFKSISNEELAKSHGSWARIDLSAIEANAKFFSRFGRLMSVIKADGYGHGALQVGLAAQKGGSAEFAVARADEAVDLRKNHFNQPLLLFGYCPTNVIPFLIEKDVAFTVWDVEQFKEIQSIAKKLKKPAKIHVNVNSGMNRLGVDVDEQNFSEFENLCKQLYKAHQSKQIEWNGLYTHFASADDTESRVTDKQLKIFNPAVDLVRSQFDDLNLTIHASNSAGTLTRGSCDFDMNRVGISLYGLQPNPDVDLLSGADVRAALSWYTQVTQVREHDEVGAGISYGHHYRTEEPGEQIATCSVGYADGFRRGVENFVIINNQLCSVVGRVTMDQIMIKIPKKLRNKVTRGTVVTLIGAGRSAADVARSWKTIDYEVVCGIGKRVARVYVDGK